MPSRLAAVVVAAIVLAVGARPATAQSETTSLTLVVTDQSGAAVPGAAVVLRNAATNVQRDGTTDATGRLTLTLLPPGDYEATVTLDGFKQVRDRAVRLQVAQPATLDVRLDIGQVAEAVEVQAAVRLLTLETASHGTVIGEEKVHALPLNGRQFIQLALLVPGANPGGRAVQQNATGRLNQVGGLSIGGGRTNSTMFLVDGAINTDPDYNALSYSPAIDTISEFQVQTSQFAAEYGAGGQVNVVTKSGAEQFRGSLFEYARNRRFDSKPFNLSGDLPEFQRDNFGGTLGGPIAPRRAFFFFSYEQLRRREGAANLTTVTVPTELERQGNFAQSPGGGIFDPSTGTTSRTQFPNNTIPGNRIDPLSLAAIRALPLPNSGVRGYVNDQEITQQNTYNSSIRIDANAASGSFVFARLSGSVEDALIPETVPGRLNLSNGRPINAAAGWTRVLSSRAVNEARFGFSQLRLTSGLPELTFTVDGAEQSIPRFVISGYPSIGGAGAFTGTNGGGVVQVRNRTFQMYDNVSWQRGGHAFKTGAAFLWIEYDRTEVPSTLGTFTFVGGYTSRAASNDGTGNALASLLLGLPQIGTRAVGPSTISGRQPSLSAYLQDDWRLGRLTLNLGLRYEIAPPLYDANGQMATIDYSRVPTPQQIFADGRLAYYTPTVVVCSQNGFPRGCAYTDTNNVAPRAGFSWHASDRVAVRGGAGVYYLPQDGNPLFRLAAGIPGNIAQTITYNAFVPGHAPGYDIFGPAILGPVQIQQAGIDPHQQTGRSTQWTFGAQRELGRDWVADVGYVGSHAVNLEQNVQPNNAQPGLGAVDPRRPYAALLFAPNTTFPGYVVVQGDRVPVGQINYFPHSARSDYHALETRLEKRFARGLSVLAAYTLSDARSNAPQFRNAGGVNGSENSPPQNSFDLEAEWGPAYYNARHRWVTSFTWALPFGAGQKYVRSGGAAALLGGWQLAGIWTMQSGFPFTVNIQGDTAGVGGGSGGIFIRANAVPGGDPYLASSEWSNGRYLNPAAFSAPPPGAFGNVGRNSLVGPGYADLDLTISRSINLRGRTRVELRVESFNLANRINYNLVGRVLNASNFGQLLSQYDPRQWQFGARVQF